MLVIGNVPKKLNGFFGKLEPLFEKRQYRHFCALVLAISIAHGRRNIAHLNLFMEDRRLRQRRQDFLVKSPWDGASALSVVARGVLDSMDPQDGELLEVIIDGSHTVKRGKTMEGAHRYFDPVTKSYQNGHAFVLCVLRFRGVAIAWAVRPWLSRVFCRAARGKELGVTFKTTNQIAADLLRELPEDLVSRLHVRALFDSAFLNEEVVGACRERKFHFISIAKSNRVFFPRDRVCKRKVSSYGPGVVRTEGKTIQIEGAKGKVRFRAAVRDGYMRGIGEVRVVFSKRESDGSFATLVTDEADLQPRGVILGYKSRWSIEVMLKNLKQCLGLGDYQTTRYEGFIHHLHLCLISLNLLITLGIGSAEKSSDDAALKVESIWHLQDRLRNVVASDHMSRLTRIKDPAKLRTRLRALFRAA